MIQPFQKIDLNKEFFICRYKNGIKLMPPDRVDDTCYNTGYSVEAFLKLPFCIGFIDTNYHILQVNEESASVLGFSSPKSAVNKSIYDVADTHSSEVVINNYKKIYTEKHIKIHEEHILLKNEIKLHRILIHSPIYNNEDKIIGLTGMTIVVGKHSISDSLSKAIELRLIDMPSSQQNNMHLLENKFLSKREKECLNQIVRGKSARAIADLLGLSKRTVEGYLENIKNKLNVSTKSELIAKIFDKNFN